MSGHPSRADRVGDPMGCRCIASAGQATSRRDASRPGPARSGPPVGRVRYDFGDGREAERRHRPVPAPRTARRADRGPPRPSRRTVLRQPRRGPLDDPQGRAGRPGRGPPRSRPARVRRGGRTPGAGDPARRRRADHAGHHRPEGRQGRPRLGGRGRPRSGHRGLEPLRDDLAAAERATGVVPGDRSGGLVRPARGGPPAQADPGAVRRATDRGAGGRHRSGRIRAGGRGRGRSPAGQS